jgi:hypothetical protein
LDEDGPIIPVAVAVARLDEDDPIVPIAFPRLDEDDPIVPTMRKRKGGLDAMISNYERTSHLPARRVSSIASQNSLFTR